MMEDGKEKTESTNTVEREEIFSRAVRAGKRTYFFDVKATRRDDYYLTITESKKRFSKDGRYFFEKHKIFLYKEDFEKFVEGLTETLDFIRSEKPYTPPVREEKEETNEEMPEEVAVASEYTNVEFEDLGEKE